MVSSSNREARSWLCMGGGLNADGESEVGRVYWEENDLEKIVRYCQKDVVALVQVYQRLCGLEVISHDRVKIVSAE